MKVAVLALLLLAPACTFKTDAIDGMIGTSCSHYELSRLTTEQGEACWREKRTDGECFMSAEGACGPHATEWPPGTELVQWCPIGNPGTEVTEVVPCE
jgi:hypothetical protein